MRLLAPDSAAMFSRTLHSLNPQACRTPPDTFPFLGSNCRVNCSSQMEAAHRTALAKGEVGIRERKPVPTLAKFAEDKFLPFVRSTKVEKPRTITFYETTVGNLKSFGKLARLPLDRINSKVLGEFVAYIGRPPE